MNDYFQSLYHRHHVIKEDGEYQASTRFLEIGEHSRERRKFYQGRE